MNAASRPLPDLVSEAARAQFERDGYFVLPHAIPPEHHAAMLSACDAFIHEYDESDTVETAKDLGAQRIRMSRDGRQIRDNIITQKGERYFLQGRHEESAAMQAFLHSDVVGAICAATLGRNAYLANEQFVVKAPGGKGDFSWHQDSGYATYDHPPYITVWCALDEATAENGTISVLPYDRAGTRDRVEHVRVAGSNDAVGYHGDDPGDLVEVPAGSIVVFSSTMFHRSGPNRSASMRRAFIGQFSREPFMSEDGAKVRNFADPILRDGMPVAPPQVSRAA